ncbi:SRPBCC domain-containing protein [Paenibacillus sp. N1-5-1-14]|uniref:SRPBCC family protein n=1 Tax=Paenibacillus radicibacter TaxID=2972488 RepID=UPI00215918AE|nr:SRPBCC domain-containing protein [Paenibacillus radicibacter]MCR8642019.1 SRPBCC domain-containing protein [Paenibacillus radicibacter]
MPNIEHLQIVKVPASKVYEALTTAEGLSEVWTNELMVQDQIGFVNEFFFGSNDITKMQVVELEKNRKIVWKCIDSDPEWVDTFISFEIEEKNNKSHVTLKHSDWREVTSFFRFCNYNLAMFLYSLKSYCEDGVGLPYQKRKF